MEEILLGTQIKNRREALEMSQEELCEGLCSVSNLSRIENNQQVPSSTLAKAMLERLGMSDDLYAAILDQKNTTSRALIREIRNDTIRYRCALESDRQKIKTQIREKLKELEERVKPNDISARQFLLANQAFFGGFDKAYSAEQKLAMQLEAIRLTHPKFDLDGLRSSHYSMDESILINQIADSYSEVGDKKRAIEIYHQLLKYIEKKYKALAGYAGLFCLVAHNYAIDLALEQYYKDAISVAEKGRKTCLAHGRFQSLPGFLAIQAECFFFLGDIDRSRKLYRQAYYIYEAYEDERNHGIMKREIKERLGIEMPD